MNHRVTQLRKSCKNNIVYFNLCSLCTSTCVPEVKHQSVNLENVHYESRLCSFHHIISCFICDISITL